MNKQFLILTASLFFTVGHSYALCEKSPVKGIANLSKIPLCKKSQEIEIPENFQGTYAYKKNWGNGAINKLDLTLTEKGLSLITECSQRDSWISPNAVVGELRDAKCVDSELKEYRNGDLVYTLVLRNGIESETLKMKFQRDGVVKYKASSFHPIKHFPAIGSANFYEVVNKIK